MAKFQFKETITSVDVFSARMGANTVAINGTFDDKEVGKAVKLVGESRYDLCAAGDPIEGFIVAMEVASLDGYAFGSVGVEGRKAVVFDGLQATAGVGVIALGDYVVTGTAVAKGTALTADVKVCKATDQPGVAVVSVVGAADTAAAIKTKVDLALASVAAAQKNGLHAWRVVSLGSAGTGAVGTTGIIEAVGC
jgi:hypothetical protein